MIQMLFRQLYCHKRGKEFFKSRPWKLTPTKVKIKKYFMKEEALKISFEILQVCNKEINFL